MIEEPIREQILAAIVAQLEGIGPETGYRTAAPKAVCREDKTIEEFNDFPVLIVLQSETSRVQLHGVVGGQGNQFVHEFGVTVAGYVSGDDEDPPSRLLERLWDAVRLRLLRAATLDGLVRDITVQDETRYDFEGPQGAFRQDFVVIYDEAIDIP